MPAKFESKPGKYGTLYRFLVKYTDKGDFACPTFEWFTWAYDANHAEERFLDSDDEGWRILDVSKVRASA